MNIFFISKDPVAAAMYMHDKHVLKMVVESTQILSNCHDQSTVKYKRTHYNHPSCIWARSSKSNYSWLWLHAYALAKEYEYRYGREHKCLSIILSLPKFEHDTHEITPPALAMPDEYKEHDPVSSYINYYKATKVNNKVWTKRSPPTWLLPENSIVEIDGLKTKVYLKS